MNYVCSGFPHSDTELFSLGVTAKVLQPKTDLKSFRRNGVSLAQNFRYKGLSPTNYSSCEKSRWMVYLSGIRILAVDYYV